MLLVASEGGVSLLVVGTGIPLLVVGAGCVVLLVVCAGGIPLLVVGVAAALLRSIFVTLTSSKVNRVLIKLHLKIRRLELL